MKQFLLKNWKTTLFGLLTVGVSIYTAVTGKAFQGDINGIVSSVGSLLMGFGLISAADADKK